MNKIKPYDLNEHKRARAATSCCETSSNEHVWIKKKIVSRARLHLHDFWHNTHSTRMVRWGRFFKKIVCTTLKFSKKIMN